MNFIWILIVLVLILAAYLWGTSPYKHFKKLNVPHDEPFPFFGNMWPFVSKAKSIFDLLSDTYTKYKGSGLVGHYTFTTPALMVCDPELIKLIAVKDFDHFTDHFSVIAEDDDPLFGKFIFSLKGDRWKYMRNILSPAFTSSKMKNMFHLVSDCGEQLGDYLADKCQANDELAITDMKDLYTRYGNDVIATSAFGIQCDSLRQPENEFYAMGKKAVNFASGMQMLKILGYLICAPVMRFFKIGIFGKDVIGFFHNLVVSTIAQREKENIVRPDMIHLLMQARKGTLKAEDVDESNEEIKNEANRKELTDIDITAQAFIFFLGGFDTTSNNLCFASHLLASHPDIMKRVQDEVDSILEEGGGKLTYEGVQRMKYMDMVINETLRVWPPMAATDRMCVKPYTIPASKTNPRVQLKVGDAISFPVLALHRDPEYFENPMQFDPERFSDENKHKIKPFTYIPFGSGPRNCIGMRFAVMETKIALASILSRFDFKVVPKTASPLSLVKGSMAIAVDGGFWLGITPRTKD